MSDQVMVYLVEACWAEYMESEHRIASAHASPESAQAAIDRYVEILTEAGKRRSENPLDLVHIGAVTTINAQAHQWDFEIKPFGVQK